MNKQELCSFLTNMFNSRAEFASIHGSSNLMNAKYMLTADALSENVELLAEVIKERFEEKRSLYIHSSTNTKNFIFS